MRVLIVDDHAVVRQALAMMLDQEADIEVVGEAGNGQEAVAQARELLPDVVLMDINMPGMNGIDATRIIRAEHPTVRVVGLSMHEHAEQAQPMLAAGAAGYVCKTEAPEVLLAAIRACYRDLPSPATI
jgi:LuxR family transcriptional regulator, maltose regulon positive regulatory protein